jgi:hypothetical protein
MPGTAGLAAVALSRTLWTIVFVPLVAFVLHAALGRRARFARYVGWTGLGLTSFATVAQAAVLDRTRLHSRALVENFPSGVYGPDMGMLDVGSGLRFDLLSASLCAVACGAALASAVWIHGRLAPVRLAPASPANNAWAGIHLARAGACMASMADGFVALATGWTLSIGAVVWATSKASPESMVGSATRGAAALGALLFAATLLYCSFDSAWGGRPSFALERGGEPMAAASQTIPVARTSGLPARADAPESAGPAMLTLVTVPGASVFVDDAISPAFRSPFVQAAFPAGVHTIRVRRRGANRDAIVGPVSVEPGDDLTLIPLGPTLSFAGMAAQLPVHDFAGERLALTELESRGALFGTSVGRQALALLVLGAAGLASIVPGRGVPPHRRATGWLTMIALGPLPLVRCDWLAPFAGGLQTISTSTAMAMGACLALAAWGQGVGDTGVGRALDRFAKLSVSFERWVISALFSAVAHVVQATAWTAARVDAHVVGAKTDGVAERLVRAESAAEAAVGGSAARLAWGLVAIVAAAWTAPLWWPLR